MSNDARVELRLPQETLHQLQALAKTEDRTVSSMIRLAINYYLETKA
jgi:predicted DNA-binding protein